MKKIISVDSLNVHKTSKEQGFHHFPHQEFRDLMIGANGDVDVIEHLATLVRMVPENYSQKALAEVTTKFESIRHAMQMSGVRIIEAPDKKTPKGGVKHSDDQRLVVTTMSLCLKLKPDTLILVAGDGDYAPMVEELRNQGIRTEVVSSNIQLATDLKKVAWTVIDLDDVLKSIKNGVSL